MKFPSASPLRLFPSKLAAVHLRRPREAQIELSFGDFGHWFRRAAGRATTLASEATRRGLRWMSGISRSRAAFG